jgi:hypothetical protein
MSAILAAGLVAETARDAARQARAGDNGRNS